MQTVIPQSLKRLAQDCNFPLYLVGGSVRDFLTGTLPEKPDFDLAAAAPEDELIARAAAQHFKVKAVYRRTGTVKLRDAEGNDYEFTRFRTDRYTRGTHAPSEVIFTDDIALDARRRDFCANAVYYEIRDGAFIDPLNGVGDIRARVLRTVAPADKVFGEDGLRLMRLARISAQTGFIPDEECLAGAYAHACLIKDVAPERIFAEFCLLLSSDSKEGDPDAPYRGLTLLHQTGVLPHVLPELSEGDGMDQRKDFHAYDVLQHSFRCVRYAPANIRWAALLHDVGKPFCMRRDGNFYEHATEGARIASEILTRLKAPKKLTEETERLVLYHMRDYNLSMRQSKVRRELVRCAAFLDDLFALKQADFSACKDDLSPAPGVVKWKKIYAEMQREGVPFSLKELKVNGNDLTMYGIEPKKTGHVLNCLLDDCVLNGALNNREKLLKRAALYI